MELTKRSLPICACAALLAFSGRPGTAVRAQAVHTESVAVGDLCILRSDVPVAWIPLQPATWPTSIHDSGKTCVLATSRTESVVVVGIKPSAPGEVPQIDRWIIEIGSQDPPGPPTPPPDPPSPPDINNARGVGLAAFRAATAVREPEMCSKLAAVWGGAATGLEKRVGTDDDIQASLDWISQRHDEVLGSSTNWQPYRDSMTSLLNSQWDNWRKADWIEVYREIAAAMTEAAKR